MSIRRHTAGFEHGVHPHGGFDIGVGAVLVHEEFGGAVDVEVGDQVRADQRGLIFLFALFLSAGGEVGRELNELTCVLADPGIRDVVVGLDQFERLAR